MIIEINIFLCEQLTSMIIMGCPGGKINMAAVSAKRSMHSLKELNRRCLVFQLPVATARSFMLANGTDNSAVHSFQTLRIFFSLKFQTFSKLTVYW